MKQQVPQQLNERAQKALAERDKLHRHYLRAKESELKELCSERPHGPHLLSYARRIAAFDRKVDGNVFLGFIKRTTKEDWFRAAPEQVQNAAFSLAARRIIQIRISAGLPPFDDPLPGSDDDVFQILKQVVVGAN